MAKLSRKEVRQVVYYPEFEGMSITSIKSWCEEMIEEFGTNLDVVDYGWNEVELRLEKTTYESDVDYNKRQKKHDESLILRRKKAAKARKSSKEKKLEDERKLYEKLKLQFED